MEKDIFTKFSAGEIERKYHIVEKKYTKLKAAIFYLLYIVIFFSICVMLFKLHYIAMIVFIIIWVFIPINKVKRLFLQYKKVGEIKFHNSSITVSKYGSKNRTIPIRSITGIFLSIGIDSAEESFTEAMLFDYLIRSMIAYDIVIMTKSYKVSLCVLNYMEETEDDKNKFRAEMPTLFSTLELLSKVYKIRYYDKNGRPSEWI